MRRHFDPMAMPSLSYSKCGIDAIARLIGANKRRYAMLAPSCRDQHGIKGISRPLLRQGRCARRLTELGNPKRLDRLRSLSSSELSKYKV